MILACITYDTVQNRRPHAAFLAGLAFILAEQVGRLLISQTPQWMMFARWLLG